MPVSSWALWQFEGAVVIKEALALAERGFKIIRVREGAKKALDESWPSLATDDPDIISRWLKETPRANIGIVAGPSRLIIIDVDPKNGGDKTLEELQRKYEPLMTMNVRTPSGGTHYYYRAPEGIDITKDNSGKYLGKGIDVQSQSSYVVAPPSVIPEGNYTEAPTGMEPQPLPAWILTLILSARGRIGGDKAYTQDSWEAGARNSSLASFAGKLRSLGIGEDGILECLLSENARRCSPPLPEQDVKVIAKSISRYPPGGPGVRVAVPGMDAPGPDAMVGLSKSFGSACRIARDATARERVMGVGGALWCNSMTGWLMLGNNSLPEGADLTFREGCEKHFWAGPSHTPLKFSKADSWDALVGVAMENKRNPLQEALTALRWDGVKRIDVVVPESLGLAVGSLEALLLRKFMVSAVARAMTPGCKVDTVPVLVGPQGARKSQWFAALAGKEWFVDTQIRLDDKDAKLTMRKTWILEWAELDSMRGRAQEATKAFISSQVDVYRPPYARALVESPRHCVIVGTTNNEEFLVDKTGNRRFWPISVVSIDLEMIAKWREQLWAEAFAAWSGGEKWWLEKEFEEQLKTHHEKFERPDSDPWTELVLDYHQKKMAERYTTAEILATALLKPAGQWDRKDEMRVADIMRGWGWTRRRAMVNGLRVYYYYVS